MSSECKHENRELVVKTAIGEPDEKNKMIIQRIWVCKDCRKTIRQLANGTYNTDGTKYTDC